MTLKALYRVLKHEFRYPFEDRITSRMNPAGDLVVIFGKKSLRFDHKKTWNAEAIAHHFNGWRVKGVRAEAPPALSLWMGRRDVALDTRGVVIGAGTCLR